MEVIYQRCAGIDMHLRFLAVCLSSIEAEQRRKEIRTESQSNARPIGLAGLAEALRLYPCGHGEHQGLLDAGLSAVGRLL